MKVIPVQSKQRNKCRIAAPCLEKQSLQVWSRAQESRFSAGLLESLMPDVHRLNLEKLGSQLLWPVEQRGVLRTQQNTFLS